MDMDQNPQKSSQERADLYYRRPGREKHELLPEVLDDLCVRIEELEQQIQKLNGSNSH